MREEINSLLDKASKSQSAAQKLLESGYPSFAASRSYYAMFYAAEALLLTKDMAFSKHTAVVSAFGKYFVKTGIFSPDLHAFFREAFDKRAKADYALDEVSEEDARQMISNAGTFLQKIGDFIKDQSLEQ